MRPAPLLLLAFLLGAACGERIEGTAVTLAVHVVPPAAPLATASGSALTLQAGTVTIDHLTLHRCGVARPWRFELVSSAWAHGGTEPEPQIGSTVVSLTAADAQPLGVLHPTAGRYCQLEVTFSAATDASLALPIPPDTVIGSTVRVAGLLSLLQTGVDHPVDVRAAGVRTAWVPLSLTFDASHLDAQVELAIDAAKLVHGVDLDATDADQQLLDRVVSGVSGEGT